MERGRSGGARIMEPARRYRIAVATLLAAAYRVRFARFGNEVRLNFLINAKSGRCGEDCGYCSQSAISRAESPEYDILRPEELLEGAALAAERRARTYCTVISGRRPSERELDVIEQTIPRIKAKVIAGAANNQLSTLADGARLSAREILYAPDYVINAGGIISVSHEYYGGSSEDQVRADVEKIPLRLQAIFAEANKTGRPTNELADELARRLIAAGRK